MPHCTVKARFRGLKYEEISRIIGIYICVNYSGHERVIWTGRFEAQLVYVSQTDFCKFSSCEALSEMMTSPLIHMAKYSATWFRNWTSARKFRSM